jgi:acyl carrier protein
VTAADAVRGTVAELARRAPKDIRDEQKLDELGLRSLARIEIAVLLEEKLGVPVKDATVMRARTVADLIAAVTS